MCGDKNDQAKQCLRDPITKEPENQITQDNNILLQMGSNCATKRCRFMYKTKKYVEKFVQEAWIKYHETDSRMKGTFDLAVLKLKDNLFNDGDKHIGAICLAALDADMTKEEITTVGWGQRYAEIPRRDISNAYQTRAPRRTTCSTNQYGPEKYRFTGCDITFFRNNKWKCKKNVPEFYDNLKCNKYFDSAKKLFKKHLPKMLEDHTLRTIEQEFRSVKYMKIQTQHSGLTPCYKEELFFEHGWCKTESTRSPQSDEKWGFCDTSCKLASVSSI